MTTDDDTLSLVRLMTWLSPAFPVGGFAYSGGLEAAVREGHVSDAAELRDWLAALMNHGTIWNDAVLLSEAWHGFADGVRLHQAAELGSALAGSAERHLEIVSQGEAFLDAARAWPDPVLEKLNSGTPYAVAVGAVAAAHRIPLERALASYLHAVASQLVSAGIRLSVLGQKQGVALLAEIEPVIVRTAALAAKTSLDDLGSASIMADLMAIRHETIGTRLFRS